MMVSTKGRYALRVMIDLAEHDQAKYIPLKEIANRQNISEKYLESIVKSLTREHFIEGLRGKGGGYRLTQDASCYTVADVLKITEGSLAPIACLQDESNQCNRAVSCQTLPMWEGLYKVVEEYLSSITIADLANTGESADQYII